MLCEGVARGDHVFSVECAVSLALLHPELRTAHRRTVVDRLLPLLQTARSKRRKLAAAYALQYSRSPKVIAQFKSMAQTKTGRLLLDDAVGLGAFAPSHRKTRANADKGQ